MPVANVANVVAAAEVAVIVVILPVEAVHSTGTLRPARRAFLPLSAIFPPLLIPSQ